jgi:signal transduction histidine kinase
MSMSHLGDKANGRDAEERIRAVYRLMDNVVLEWDESLRLLDCTEECLRLFGADDVRDLADVFFSEQAVRQALKRALEQGFDRFVWKHRTREGDLLPCEVTLTRLLRGGCPGVLAHVRDLRPVWESAAREEAEAVANARGRFLSMVGHEVRTPLNGIMGFLQLALLQEMESGLRKHLDTAFSLSRLLLQMLNDVLDLAKMESGSVSIQVEEFSPANTVQAALASFHALVGEKNLSLRCDMDPSLPEKLSGDAARVRQLLLNLVGNAVKYTRDGRIDLEILRVPARDAMTIRVLFVVGDTGVGIPAERMAGIFEPFQRGDEDYVRKQRGAGLGLSLVRSLARMMRGELCVFSRAGQGTEMHVILPFAWGTPCMTNVLQHQKCCNRH